MVSYCRMALQGDLAAAESCVEAMAAARVARESA